MDSFFTDFHLLRPFWLLIIIPAIILIVLMKQQQKKQGQWHQVFPAHLAKLLIENKPTTSHKTSMIALIFSSVIIAIALSGPTWQRVEQPLFKIKQAQVVIADMSLSMYSTDIAPNRLTRTKFKIIDLVSRLSEGDTALLAYAGDAFVISPMTQDVANLNNLIPALNPEIMPVYGSAPSYAIEKALELFNQANHQSGEIYLITDGMDAADSREIKQLLKNTQFTLHIMGVGTAQGAPIKLPNGQLLKEDSGNIVIPKLQSTTLRNLSQSLGGRYSNLTNDASDVNYLVTAQATGELSDEQQENQFGDEWHEVGPYLILLLLPFAALAFRRGVIMSVVIIFMYTPMLSSPLMAEEQSNQPSTQPQPEKESNYSWWDDLWETKNQQAIKAFNDGDYQHAASTFDNQQWLGSSHYKQGNFEQALEHFSKGSESQDLFNQGNTLAQMQKFDEAVNRYQKLLVKDPAFPNAKENLELVKKLSQEKKEQQKQQGDESGDDKDSQEQQNNDDQSSESDKQSSDKNDSDQQESQQDESQQSNSEQESDKDSDQQQGEQSKNESDDENKSENKSSEPSDEEKQQLAKQQQEAKESQQLFNNENLSKDELQRLNQLVKKIPDNPSLLLEAKMAQESRKRRQTRMVTKERKQW